MLRGVFLLNSVFEFRCPLNVAGLAKKMAVSPIEFTAINVFVRAGYQNLTWIRACTMFT